MVRPILVIGARGQLARSLVEAGSARSRGEQPLVALGRPGLDITRPDTLEAALARHSPGLVVHCGAYTDVDGAERDQRNAMEVNAEAAGAVAASCARHGIPIIHVSTDYVYDGAKAQPYVETDPTGPTSVYGRTKLEGEARVAAACPEYIILRTAWIYSPFGHNFVKSMLRLARQTSEISVVDDQVGCPTYAPHLAEAILQIAQQLRRGRAGARAWGLYHAAGAGEATWYGLALEVFARAEEMGGPMAKVRPVSTSDYPTAANRPANSRLDCSALKIRFGIALPHWTEGVKACVARALESGSQRP